MMDQQIDLKRGQLVLMEIWLIAVCPAIVV